MSLRHALLGLVARRPASGYDLSKLFDGTLAFVWPATQSQLYLELGHLADAGLVEVSRAGPRGRKEYRITPAGRSELTRWLSDAEVRPAARNEMLLRVFLLWNLPPEAARVYLLEVASRARAFNSRLRRLAETGDTTEPPAFRRYARVVLEHGLRTSLAQAEWAEWAAGQVEDD